MHFSKLRLAGFKSFVDPTELVIEPGLTGIVGPNGCGKSNLVEALSWAMGETSAKRMRGGEMDDVIFGGTPTARRATSPRSTLSLDNTRHDAPKPYDEYDEIEVVRRIERGEGSGYRVNGKEVRARDVQLLFADAATGAHSPAIVSQGRIGAIISAKPAERRGCSRRRPGITGLHSRRHEAELRLKAAEANLLAPRRRADDARDAARRAEEAGAPGVALSPPVRPYPPRRGGGAASALASRAAAEREAAEERLRLAELDVADRTADALAAEREREAAASELPALRQTRGRRRAELQRLVLRAPGARGGGAPHRRRARSPPSSASSRSPPIIAREEALGADASAALARLEAERNDLLRRKAQEAGGAAGRSGGARRGARRGRGARHGADAAHRAGRRRRGAPRRAGARRQRGGRARRRLAARQEEIAPQRAALEAETISAAAHAEAAQSALQPQKPRSSATRAAAEDGESTNCARRRRPEAAARGAARGGRVPPRQARDRDRRRSPSCSRRRATSAIRRSSTPSRSSPASRRRSAPALGDDLTAPLDAAAPTHWHALAGLSETLAAARGTQRRSRRTCRAPTALARRLAQIGVVADARDGERLQRSCSSRPAPRHPRWRPVALGRLRRAAGTPTAAAQRLRQRNRLAEIDEVLRRDPRAMSRPQARRFATAQAGRRGAGDAERAARQAMRDALGTLADARDHDAEARRATPRRSLSRLDGLGGTAERLATDLGRSRYEGDMAAAALAALPDPAIARAHDGGSSGRSSPSARRLSRLRRASTTGCCARRARGASASTRSPAKTRSWQSRAEARAAAARHPRGAPRRAGAAEIERARRGARPRSRRSATRSPRRSRRRRRGATPPPTRSRQARRALAETERAAQGRRRRARQRREERVRCEARREQARAGRKTRCARTSPSASTARPMRFSPPSASATTRRCRRSTTRGALRAARARARRHGSGQSRRRAARRTRSRSGSRG